MAINVCNVNVLQGPNTIFHVTQGKLKTYYLGELRKASVDEWVSWKLENISPDPFVCLPILELNFHAKIYI